MSAGYTIGNPTGLTILSQFAHYHSLLKVDEKLATLVKAVINNEARYVAQFPYCQFSVSVERALL